MSKEKHTPGPWRLSPDDPRGCCVIAKGGPTICDVGPVVKGSWKANARLIAAAPELLAALQDLERMAGIPAMFDDPVRVAARAAIAKATGDPVPATLEECQS